MKIFSSNKKYTLIFLLLFFLASDFYGQSRDLESVTGKNGMVSTAHPLASKAGLEVLQNGGNAVDAAVAAAYAIGVVEPDGSGLGGGGCMVVYLQEEKKTYFINFYQKASEKVDELSYDRKADGMCVKTALVPGNVAGLSTALEKFGTLKTPEVIKYAVKYAEEGFKIDNTLAGILLDNITVFEKYPATAKIFLPGGFPLMEGDVLVQEKLANTLKTIAAKGPAGFYEGENAKKIVDGITSEGGVITLDDLKNYKAEILEPLYGNYRGYEIISSNAPQSGASLIESLNMIENIDFDKYGYYSESSTTLHLMAETFLRSYSDRYDYIGDPKFGDIPIHTLLSKEYAKDRFENININNTLEDGYRKTPSGNAYEYETGVDVKTKTLINDAENSGHTTHISVVDKDGNMVSLTQTLGTFFGCGYSVEGVIFNSSYINFSSQAEINKVEPGKTPRSTISPTVILKDGKPFMAIGTPGGGRIISTLAEIIVNVIDFQMTAESANRAPRFYCQVNDDYLNLENRIHENVIKELEDKGHKIKVYGDYDLFFGGAQFIVIDWDKHTYYGTADVRRGGQAIGY